MLSRGKEFDSLTYVPAPTCDGRSPFQRKYRRQDRCTVMALGERPNGHFDLAATLTALLVIPVIKRHRRGQSAEVFCTPLAAERLGIRGFVVGQEAQGVEPLQPLIGEDIALGSPLDFLPLLRIDQQHLTTPGLQELKQ